MKVYEYIGKNLNGQIIKGRLEVNNDYEVLKYVKEKGYYLVLLQLYNSNKILVFNKRKINYETISIFCNQFQITLQAGLTILKTLHILYLQCSSKILKENLQFIIQQIKKGESLYSSLIRCPFVFPPFLCNMIRIGEESGRLDEILKELSTYYYKEHKLKKRIISAMFYPAIVCITTLLSIIMLMVTVIPSITSVLISLNADLPLTTRLIMNFSNLLKNHFILFVSSTVLITSLLIIFIKYLKINLHTSAFLFKVPVIGRVYRNTVEMQFSRVLKILLSSGINIIRALEIVEETTKNDFLGSKLKDVVNEIKKGHSISEAMSNVSFFSKFTLSLIKIGEETGNLEIMLEKAVVILEENVDSDIGKLTELIQPVMIIIMAVIVGGIIASVILPIFSIANAI